MLFRSSRACFLILSTVLVFQGAHAGVEFSADLKQTTPAAGARTGKIFVGNNVMRSEFEVNGGVMIQIMDNTRKEIILINPISKSFMRRKAAAGEAMPVVRDANTFNPCAGLKDIKCEQADMETINGRAAKKWKFSSLEAKDAVVMTTWIDEIHGFPVKQQLPDGTSMEMQLLGPDTVSGRKVEKWELVTRSPDGRESMSALWYDAELKMNIREEHPGGFRREILNIKLQKQEESLFAVPAGYREAALTRPDKDRLR